jgi:FO synthase
LTPAGDSRVARRYGHIQEVIVQNFAPVDDSDVRPLDATQSTRSDHCPARLIFGGATISAPPPDADGELYLDAGINDWGVSPLTPDFINPSALAAALAQEKSAQAGSS